eukprot:COSAG02_NODE_1230_length_13767_cov_16.238294_15_plen_38_part_00
MRSSDTGHNALPALWEPHAKVAGPELKEMEGGLKAIV